MKINLRNAARKAKLIVFIALTKATCGYGLIFVRRQKPEVITCINGELLQANQEIHADSSFWVTLIFKHTICLHLLAGGMSCQTWVRLSGSLINTRRCAVGTDSSSVTLLINSPCGTGIEICWWFPNPLTSPRNAALEKALARGFVHFQRAQPIDPVSNLIKSRFNWKQTMNRLIYIHNLYRPIPSLRPEKISAFSIIIPLTMAIFSIHGWSQKIDDEEDILKILPVAKPSVFRLNNDSSLLNFSEDEGLSQSLRLLHLPPRFDEIALLKKEWVQDELSMDATQKRHYREIFDTFLKHRTPVPDALTDNLDQTQRARFRDLVIRCRIRSLGIVEFFSHQKFGLTKSEFMAIRDLVAELQPVYFDKMHKLREESLKDYYQILDRDQRQRLSECSGGYLELYPPSFELFTWHLRNSELYSDLWVEEHLRRFRGMFMGYHFHIDVDGNFEMENYLFSIDQFDQVSTPLEQLEKEAMHELLLFNAIRGLARDPTSIEELQFVDQQIDQIKGIATDYYKMESEWFNKMIDVQGGPLEQQVRGDYRQWQKNYLSEKNQELKSLLLPHQRELIETINILFEIQRGGLPSALLYGETGVKLRLNSAQKKEIVALNKKQRLDIERVTLEWENEIIVKVIDKLPEPFPIPLRDVFRSNIKTGLCNIGHLLKGGN